MQTIQAVLDCTAPNNVANRLERLDAQVRSTCMAAAQADRRTQQISSEIICTATLMVAILFQDIEAWQEFKSRHNIKVACKGAGWQYREIATVVWRHHRAQPHVNRERVSQYGRAIQVAYQFYRDGEQSPAALLERIKRANGVRGLIRLASRSPKAPSQRPRRVSLEQPERPVLVLLKPGSQPQVIPDEIARPILIQIGVLQ